MRTTAWICADNSHGRLQKGLVFHATYHMDLNFCGTKLLRVENFCFFRVFIFADAQPHNFILNI